MISQPSTAAQSISQLLQRIWCHISPRRRLQFALLFALMVVASFAEVLSIGAVLPFLSALTAPERVFAHPLAQPVIRTLGVSSADQLLLPLTIVFVVAALVSGAMRLTLLWVSTALSSAIGADFSISIYRRTLYQPYSVHVSRNSSEVIAGISSKAHSLVGNAIQPVLTLLSSLLLLIAILAALIAMDPLIASAAFGGFGAIYIVVAWLARKRLAIDSDRVNHEATQVIKALQEGLGGIRDVLIDGTQAAYCEIYRNADMPLRRALANLQIIGASPRYGVEALGMVLIAGLAYFLAGRPEGITSSIPVLGALALGAQRLLPVFQQVYASWSSMRGGRASLQNALDLLDQPLPKYVDEPPPEPLPFSKEIVLSKLGFSYSPEAPPVLSGIDLVIPRGGRIGIIGTTGSGKSTLIDIVMGLLLPTEGAIEIDGKTVTNENHRAWQAHVAHVPQAIFLADTSIEENIAFGVPKEKIDNARVRDAARKAQIAEIVESWPLQYKTLVGERGVRLSGGQRQRIGIARALYKNADVIVFDEATSALDNETERAVMQAIENLGENLTAIMIAHRLTTLKNCTQIVELANGKIERSGRYDEIVSRLA